MATWPAYRCPLTWEPLTEQRHTLRSEGGASYPVVDGIPRFVPASSYADHFGAQWKRYRLVQLDSHTGQPISTDRARRCLGEDLWNGLRGKLVLEVGCGAGRFTEILLSRGARVTSVDLSAAVEANQENFPQDDHHRIAQADVRRLPFAPHQFDLVFCIGVVQHTPDSDQTVRALFDQVAPGGWLVFDHYTPNLSAMTKFTEPLLRRYLIWKKTDEAFQWTEGLVDRLLPLHAAARRLYPAQALLSRVSPVRAYYHRYPELNDAQQREWALLDTHDALTSVYRHWRTCGEARRLLEGEGAGAIEAWRGGNGIEVRAQRPGR